MKSFSDVLFDSIVSEIDRITGKEYTAKTVDQMTEDELKAALEKKVKEKQQKNSRAEQLTAKVKTMLREEIVFTVCPESTKDIAMIKFSTPSGVNGTAAINLKNDVFFN